ASVALIRAEEGVPEAVRARLEQITVAVQRGAALATRLVRHRSSRELQPRPLYVNDLVNNALEMVRPLLTSRIGVKAEFWSVPTVLVDPSRIEQVLINIILNALDAMPGGGELTLRTEVVGRVAVEDAELDEESESRATSFVCVTVADTGIGIPQRLQSRIF